jgi:glycerol-3-phosphate dehydrogenase
MIGNSKVMKAEVVHAVKEEMARTMSDVVFRRTDLSTGSNPGPEALAACSDIMASMLNWDSSRREAEMQNVLQKFPAFSG